MNIEELFQKIRPYLEERHISIGGVNCCRIFLLANGFSSKNVKFGKTEIHIRSEHSNLVHSMNMELQTSGGEITSKFKKSFNDYIRHKIYISLRFMGIRKFFFR